MSEHTYSTLDESLLPMDREPEHVFFPDEIDGHNRGQSWDTEIYGFHATVGRIEAGTTARYTIDSPELIVIARGEVTAQLGSAIDRGDQLIPMHAPFVRNTGFGLPAAEVVLTIPSLDEQRQRGDYKQPSDLIYACFYPVSEQEQTEIMHAVRSGTKIPQAHFWRHTLPQYSDSRKMVGVAGIAGWAGFEL